MHVKDMKQVFLPYSSNTYSQSLSIKIQYTGTVIQYYINLVPTTSSTIVGTTILVDLARYRYLLDLYSSNGTMLYRSAYATTVVLDLVYC